MSSDALPTFGTFFGMKIAKALATRDKPREATHVHAWFQLVIRLVFHLAGFGCLTYGAFLWHSIAGFVVAGFSFFAMSFLLTSRPTAQPAVPPNHSWATGDRRG